MYIMTTVVFGYTTDSMVYSSRYETLFPILGAFGSCWIEDDTGNRLRIQVFWLFNTHTRQAKSYV